MTSNTGNAGRDTHLTIKKGTGKQSTPQKGDIIKPQKERQKYLQHKKGINQNELIIAILLWLIVGILLWIVIHPQQVIQQQIEQNPRIMLTQFKTHMMDEMKNGGCIGINKFLTFTNFTHDLEVMQTEYLSKYSSELNNVLGNMTNLFPPAALTFDLKGIDCEDMAMWASCLANYYPGVTCRIYYQIFENVEHVGLECQETLGNYTYYTRI